MVNYPEDWRNYKIGDNANVLIGEFVHSSFLNDLYKYPVYNGGTKNTGYYKFYNRTGNQVVISARGENAGYVNFVKEKFWSGNSCYTISNLSKKLHADYLYFYLKWKYIERRKSREEATIPSISKKDILSSIVVAPSVEVQKNISTTLNTLSNHADYLSLLIEKKKMIRDGVLEDLMTGQNRLDGFDNKWINANFNDFIIPKARIGWQGLRTDEYLKNGYSYLISGTDFEEGSLSLDNINYVSKDRYKMDTNIQVETGNVLVTKDGTVGKVAQVPNLSKPATLNSGVYVFRTNSNLDPKFLYYTLLSSQFKKFIELLSAGSTIQHLYQKDLKNFKFLMPKDIKEQKAIADTLATMDKEIESLENELEKVEQIKEAAMDDLLTGKIRLK